MKARPVAVVGVSGYSGVELVRLLGACSSFEIVAAVADRWKGERLGDRVRPSGSAAGLVVQPMSDVIGACSKAEVALLATPAEASARFAPDLLARGVRVIDLSGAFRLEDLQAYKRWYDLEHPAPALLAEARYGLPEVAAASGTRAPATRAARLVANPGCYATAAILALAPLLAAKAIEPNVFVDGKSGVTGAGRKVEERFLFTEVDENVTPYRVARHQHAPEIELALSRVAGRPVQVTFVPHLLPIRRGLSCTAFGRLASGASAADVEGIVAKYYERAALVDVVAPEAASIADVASTPRALVATRADAERGSVVAIGVLDNLLKGAASQALQNLCAMTGVPCELERGAA